MIFELLTMIEDRAGTEKPAAGDGTTARQE
jgi:hypothetical protein